MTKPPIKPTKSAMMVSSGSVTQVAITRGVTSFLHRVGTQRAHRVDLLGDLHGAEFARDAGSVAPGHQQRSKARDRTREPG